MALQREKGWASLRRTVRPPAPLRGASILLVVPLLLAVGAATAPPQTSQGSVQSQEKPEPVIDPKSRLIVSEGLELVKEKCLSCHTSRLISQNRGTREHWQGMIRWMEETQGLEPLLDSEAPILDYLEANYGIEDKPQRRAPIAKELMPPA